MGGTKRMTRVGLEPTTYGLKVLTGSDENIVASGALGVDSGAQKGAKSAAAVGKSSCSRTESRTVRSVRFYLMDQKAK